MTCTDTLASMPCSAASASCLGTPMSQHRRSRSTSLPGKTSSHPPSPYLISSHLNSYPLTKLSSPPFALPIADYYSAVKSIFICPIPKILLLPCICHVSCVPLSARDYTSPHTLRVEFGIAQEMEQMDRNFKVQQMLGAKK